MASVRHKGVFIDALLKEIELQKDYLGTETVETIYFGGGTPSMLSVEELNGIFLQLYKYFKIDSEAEITIEANPDDLNKNKVIELATLPVNRLSLGVQSFQEADLKYLHRSHSANQAIQSIKILQDAGFQNISLDLIFGIPTLENSSWIKNLEIFKELNIPHLSAYALTVEPKTALDLFIKNKKYAPVSDIKTVDQFNILMNWAEQNEYSHYEISNYCKKEFYSKHNTNYWRQKKYLGLGPSAHSYNQTTRQWNISNVMKYSQELLSGNLAFEVEELTQEQKINEYIMVSLRTLWGIDLTFVDTNFGNHIRQKIENEAQRFIDSKELIKSDKQILLTKKGKLMVDGISSSLFL